MLRLLLALVLLLTACQRQPSSGPGIVFYSELLDAALPAALPPGPNRDMYRRQLEQLAAGYGLACNHPPEVMLSHTPDVLLEQMQEATTYALWSPVGHRSGVYVVSDAALLVVHRGSAVLVCQTAARMIGYSGSTPTLGTV